MLDTGCGRLYHARVEMLSPMYLSSMKRSDESLGELKAVSDEIDCAIIRCWRLPGTQDLGDAARNGQLLLFIGCCGVKWHIDNRCKYLRFMYHMESMPLCLQ